MTKLLEPPPGRPVFEMKLMPQASDIDANGHVNNVVYLRWVQEIAIAHWAARAPAEEQGLWAWIVLRHEVDYRRALVLGEVARGRTWVDEGADGPRFDRYVRIDGPDGAMCAQAITTWVLVEAATGRPRRVPEWMVAVFCN